MQGVITSRHILTHGATVIRSFGLRVYCRCCWCIVCRRNKTFLECVWK